MADHPRCYGCMTILSEQVPLKPEPDYPGQEKYSHTVLEYIGSPWVGDEYKNRAKWCGPVFA